MGTPQRWSGRKAAFDANEAMKLQLLPKGGNCKARVGGAPKREAIGFPQAGEFDSADAVYLSESESEREDEDMCMVSDDEGPAPSPSNRISTKDWDEEQYTMLGMCAANLKRMSLGPECDALACIDAKNVKR